MNKLEILKAARDTLANKGWTKHFFAFDAQGNMCRGWNKDACKFCALGALEHVMGQPSPGNGMPLVAFEIWDALANEIPHTDEYEFDGIGDFNDHAESVDEVLALFDRVIAKLEAE